MARKAFTDGTHRICSPGETLERVRPLLRGFGITRIADVTGLDRIGIPVVMAVRPLAATLSVSQGKGPTFEAAAVSAVMESLEFHHAEFLVPDAVVTAPAAELDLDYPFEALDHQAGSIVGEDTTLGWIRAEQLIDGAARLVPRELVAIGADEGATWRPTGLRPSTNGLASGNDVAEATLHALYELIERDALARLAAAGGGATALDPGTVADPGCAQLIGKITAAGVWLEVLSLDSPTGIPCFAAHIWSADAPIITSGAGAHADPAVAMSRAISEAAQSRLTIISGTRDDLAEDFYLLRPGLVRPPETPGQLHDAAPHLTGAPEARLDVADELRAVVGAVARLTGHQPMVVDLSTVPEFAVVKVIAPGVGFEARHEVPRP